MDDSNFIPSDYIIVRSEDANGSYSEFTINLPRRLQPRSNSQVYLSLISGIIPLSFYQISSVIGKGTNKFVMNVINRTTNAITSEIITLDEGNYSLDNASNFLPYFADEIVTQLENKFPYLTYGSTIPGSDPISCWEVDFNAGDKKAYIYLNSTTHRIQSIDTSNYSIHKVFGINNGVLPTTNYTTTYSYIDLGLFDLFPVKQIYVCVENIFSDTIYDSANNGSLVLDCLPINTSMFNYIEKSPSNKNSRAVLVNNNINQIRIRICDSSGKTLKLNSHVELCLRVDYRK